MLINLAINARDAMPDGGTLSFDAANVRLDEAASNAAGLKEPGRYVRLTVSDTGSGIPPEILDRIFDPFFTTKELGKGTGLGLATCMGIVTSHGGGINVYSEPARGTAFTVYLPAESDTATEDDSGTVTIPRGRGEQILIIDDEEPILMMVQATLAEFGFKALTASDGPAGISLFELHHEEIDAVIVDMMMPGLDGPATIKRLKTINADIPIIASSGLRRPESGTNQIAGSTAFLPKPYSDDELLQTLAGILQ